MGMSTNIIGIVPPDEKFKKMLAVYDACKVAGTEMPDEIEEFFNWETPNPLGVEIEIEKTEAVKEYEEDASEGFTVEVAKVPKHIKYIRFWNSY